MESFIGYFFCQPGNILHCCRINSVKNYWSITKNRIQHDVQYVVFYGSRFNYDFGDLFQYQIKDVPSSQP